MPRDLLDGFFRRLVDNLSSLDPGALHRPVRVAEIHERLVPYRTHRAMLGFDSHEDYEMTVLRLLAGERGLAQVFPADVAEALAREAASVNPDTAIFRQFPDATVLLNPEAAKAEGDAGRSNPVEAQAQEVEVPGSDQQDEEDLSLAPEDTPLPFVLEEEEQEPRAQPRAITASVACNYCGGSLPVGRTVLFCPHCGNNIGVVHCHACGSELDVGWEFCITCGQKVAGLG